MVCYERPTINAPEGMGRLIKMAIESCPEWK
jgi:hypothetical protein